MHVTFRGLVPLRVQVTFRGTVSLSAESRSQSKEPRLHVACSLTMIGFAWLAKKTEFCFKLPDSVLLLTTSVVGEVREEW